MKVLRIAAILLVTVTLTSCKAKQKNVNEMSLIVEDHVTETYSFPKGIYFEYVFEESRNYEFDELALICKLKDKGFKVRNVWYKPGSSMCVPPGSSEGMTVIVEPRLVVQLFEDDARILGLGFKLTDNPSMGGCAYRVKHYVIKK